MKKITALFLALTLCLCLSMPVFAAEARVDELVLNENETIVYQDDDITVVQVDAASPKNVVNYESVWLNSSAACSFPIYTSNSGTIGVTFKVESSSNSSWAAISLQKPNGSYYDGIYTVDPTTNDGDGAYFHIYFASSGTYTVHYSAYTSVGMRIMCWMY